MSRPFSFPGAHRVRGLLLCAALSLLAPRAAAQDLIRTTATWRTVQTRWFDVHYPTDAEAWTLDLAPRLDAMHDAVAALVGYAPPGRTTVVIDDPYNVANGKAIPILGAPVIHLWVTPPGPTDQIANHRGWGLKLASHEFGHIAHLSRPARRSQWFWHLLPAQVSPVTASTPRWAIEGYATWIEGKVTGSGRPHGAWRPALLRELALAGRLPGYGALSSGGGYKGGSMAYLAGSAFWEWLAAQRGDSSMTLVFRRQSARTPRSFDDAFRGVYGESPATLYSRFAAELTARAFAVDTALRARGLVTGTRLARISGMAGGPAATVDGSRIALVLPGIGGAPRRLIVTVPDTQQVTKAERDQLQRALARDPQDVPAIRLTPRLQKPIATLLPRRGRTFGNPRFINAAGTVLLLESWSVRADGTQRPDLVTWNVVTGDVRPVTDGAAVQDADPAPDGTRAAAIRCVGGVCDLVMVSLDNGAVTTLAKGSPRKVFSHPRWSHDGRRLVVSVQDRDGLWRLALVDPATGAESLVTPDDDINRHSASFDAADAELVYVSEADGIPNVETLRLSDGVRTARTRVDGSVYEPTPLPGGAVLFLSEYAGGVDLQRVLLRDVVRGEGLGAEASRLVPVMPMPRVPGMELAESPVTVSTPYRAGPRMYRLLAQASLARDGMMQVATLASADPANRLTWMLSGMGGTASAWRGGVAGGVWYGTRPHVRAETFWLEQRATRQGTASVLAATDFRIAGASLAAELPIAGTSAAQRMGVSLFAGASQRAGAGRELRTVLSTQYAGTVVTGWRASAGLTSRAAVGQVGDSSFARASIGGFVSAHRMRLDARTHRTTAATPRTEQYSAGGFAPPLHDEATLAQRLAVPALPSGIVTGRALYELRFTQPAPLLPVTLYAHSIGANWRPDRHSLVVGLEQGFEVDYLGLIGLPRLRALAGAALIARGPLRDKGSAYLLIGFRP